MIVQANVLPTVMRLKTVLEAAKAFCEAVAKRPKRRQNAETRHTGRRRRPRPHPPRRRVSLFTRVTRWVRRLKYQEIKELAETIAFWTSLIIAGMTVAQASAGLFT